MTIDEAIDRNKELRGELLGDRRLEKAAAVKLGIEALKAIKAHRKDFRKGDIYQLPGETESFDGV